MKKMVVFMFMVVCLFCNSVMCFADTEVTTTYREKYNDISHCYEQNFSLKSSGKTDLIADFNYYKNYKFNKNFDQITKVCSPSDFVLMIFWDYCNELKYIKNEIVLTDLETGESTIIPYNIDRKKSDNGKYDLLSIGLWPSETPEFIDFALADRPFRISFNFVVSPSKGTAKNLTFDFDREELNKLQSVINYDLYSDPSQTENIKKAVAAIPAN